MGIYYDQAIPTAIPHRLMIRIPKGETITGISHISDGASAVVAIEVGLTDQVQEETNYALCRSAVITGGGNQVWSGRMVAMTDLYVKAWLRSVATGGGHTLLVLTDNDGVGGTGPNSSQLVFVAKPKVIQVLFSKGLVVDLNCPVGHNYEIVSYQMVVACDGTVATRNLNLFCYDAASGGGNAIARLMQGSFTASQSKTMYGGSDLPATYGANDAAHNFGQLVIPSLGSLHSAESNFVAGDAWSIRIMYRDYPVDVMI